MLKNAIRYDFIIIAIIIVVERGRCRRHRRHRRHRCWMKSIASNDISERTWPRFTGEIRQRYTAAFIFCANARIQKPVPMRLPH